MQNISREVDGDNFEMVEGLKSAACVVDARHLATKTVPVTLLDTFDWRLYHHGFCLFRSHGNCRLVDLSTGKEINHGRARARRRGRTFAADLEEGALRCRLSDVIGVRALLELLSGEVQSDSFESLNADGKVIVRVVAHAYDWTSAPNTDGANRFLEMRGLRGYAADLSEVSKTLSRLKKLGSLGFRDVFDNALSIKGLKPFAYSSRPTIKFNPDVTWGEAAVTICLATLKIMRLNEQGVKNDWDPEFLHDFRVSIRRSRAALGQIRGAFIHADAERFKNDLELLAKLTNSPRDLDVMLLKRGQYESLLPAAARRHLRPFFDTLKRQRRHQRGKLIDMMSSPRYESLVSSWERFLRSRGKDGGCGGCGGEADRPALGEASKAIRKRFRKVVAAGSAIESDTPDQYLHKVRIQCKKLRYLLEFFSSLYPDDAIRELVKQLKTLQNNLGDYNDLAVHIGLTSKRLSAIAPNSADVVERAAALGALIAALELRKREIRSQFESAFNDFRAPANVRMFDELFGEP